MEKSSFLWGIVSYKRHDRQPMLNYLSNMGYTKEEIILSLQTKEDYEIYKELYDQKATIIYREGNNISDNKNTILDYVVENCGNTRIVMCSDKVRGVQWLPQKGKLKTIETREEMDKFVKKAFFVTKQLKGSLFGLYSVGNAFYMEHSISTNRQMLGCFMGIPDPSQQRFDPEQPLKEDFEFIMHHVKEGRTTIRFNDVVLLATLHTQGGCHDFWKDTEVNRKCTERLLKMYPNLCKRHATRKNELKDTAPSYKIKKSIFEI